MSRGIALALLIGLTIGLVAQPHGEGRDDLACAPIAVAHDEAAHSIRAESTRPHQEGQHCFLCHSVRSFSPAADRFEQRLDALAAERLTPAPVAASDLFAWARLPGRAPPV